MPSKASQHIAFFGVLILSALLHRFVYQNLRRVILRDYPTAGPRLQRVAFWTFVAMDLPFIFIFFRGAIDAELHTVTRVVLYTFSVWQSIMILWSLILIPVTILRKRERLGVAYARKLATRWRERDVEGMEEPSEEELVMES